MVWCCHDHGVNIFASDHFTPIEGTFRLVTVSRAFLAFFVHVANRNDFRIGVQLGKLLRFRFDVFDNRRSLGRGRRRNRTS